MTYELAKHIRLHRSWRDSHGELNAAPHRAADRIESLEAKLEKAREIAERLVDQRDEPVPNETQRLHYWRDKAIKSAQALKEISQ